MSPEERQRHIDLVRGLSMSGGVLEKDAPTATINNREWFRSNGSPRPERRALHDQLYAEVRAQFPEARQDACALVLAGPPGAGKGSVAEKVLGAEISEFVNVDADEFKKLLLREAIADGSYESTIKPAEVREMEATGETFYPLELASLVHTESSRLAAALREDLIAEKTNVVVDTVLGDETSADGLADQLTRAGYEVAVIDVEVPYLVSEDRIKMRWQEAMAEAEAGKAGALGGRWVPSTYARPLFDTEHGRSKSQDVAARLAEACPNVRRYERHFTSLDEHQSALREGRRAEPVREIEKIRAAAGAPLVDQAKESSPAGSDPLADVRAVVTGSYQRSPKEATRGAGASGQQPPQARRSGPGYMSDRFSTGGLER